MICCVLEFDFDYTPCVCIDAGYGFVWSVDCAFSVITIPLSPWIYNFYWKLIDWMLIKCLLILICDLCAYIHFEFWSCLMLCLRIWFWSFVFSPYSFTAQIVICLVSYVYYDLLHMNWLIADKWLLWSFICDLCAYPQTEKDGMWRRQCWIQPNWSP